MPLVHTLYYHPLCRYAQQCESTVSLELFQSKLEKSDRGCILLSFLHQCVLTYLII